MMYLERDERGGGGILPTIRAAAWLLDCLQGGLGDTGPLGIADVDVVLADQGLVLGLVPAGNGITPVRVTRPPGLLTLLLLRAPGAVLPEADGDTGGGHQPGGVVLEVELRHPHEVPVTLEAAVDHLV